MEKTITIKKALEQGFEYFFIVGGDSERVHDIRDEAQECIDDGDVIMLAEKADHMILDAQSIFENACEELHEEAYDNVYGSEEYKLFEKVCEYVSKALRPQTQSYRETNIEIRAE